MKKTKQSFINLYAILVLGTMVFNTLFFTLCLISIFSSKCHASDAFDNPKVKECLKKEMPKCGKERLPLKGPFTEEQRKISICRIVNLAKCLELDKK